MMAEVLERTLTAVAVRKRTLAVTLSAASLSSQIKASHGTARLWMALPVQLYWCFLRYISTPCF